MVLLGNPARLGVLQRLLVGEAAVLDPIWIIRGNVDGPEPLQHRDLAALLAGGKSLLLNIIAN
jgi:hypothetical protein